MLLTAKSITIKYFVSKCNFFFHFFITHCLKTWSFNSVCFSARKQTIVMKLRNNCDMWTRAQQNRNDSEALCPVCQLSAQRNLWLDWVYDRAAGLYNFLWVFGPVRGHIACGLMISMYSFPRWASDDFGIVASRACQIRQAPILVGSTGPVFATYYSARLAVGCSKALTASARAHTASEGAPYKTRRVHVRVHAILGQNRKNTQNQENACDSCIAGGYGLPTDHRLVWLPKSYGPGNTRGFHACDLCIRYFMLWSHEARTVYHKVERVPVGNHKACIASPHDVSKNFVLCRCRISHGWRLSMYNFQTWATNNFDPQKAS